MDDSRGTPPPKPLSQHPTISQIISTSTSRCLVAESAHVAGAAQHREPQTAIWLQTIYSKKIPALYQQSCTRSHPDLYKIHQTHIPIYFISLFRKPFLPSFHFICDSKISDQASLLQSKSNQTTTSQTPGKRWSSGTTQNKNSKKIPNQNHPIFYFPYLSNPCNILWFHIIISYPLSNLCCS